MVIALLIATLLGSEKAVAYTTVINGDRGGIITNYVAKYQWWAAYGHMVIIDGPCNSACTVIIGTMPRRNWCVTPHGSFGFHGAYYTSWDFQKHEAPAGTKVMLRYYNADTRAWIKAHGGLKTYKRMLYLKWPETKTRFRVCTSKDKNQ